MMTAIDLFAGCGGLSLGLKWAGWKIACAVERSPMAAETYYANFIYGDDKFEVDARYASHIGKSVPDQVKAGLLVDDIRTFRNHIASVNEVLGGQEIALLAGGPPCQGFSIAGKRNASDPRNDLVWRFLEAAELLLPPLVMLENVGAIQSPFEKGRQESVLPDLERALHLTGMAYGGYSTARLVLGADQYGVPQRRKRVFLVGVRKDLASEMGMPDHDCWDSGRIKSELSRPQVAPARSSQDPPSAGEAIWDLAGDEYAPIESAPGIAALQYAHQARTGQGSCSGRQETTIADGKPPNHVFRAHKDTTKTRFHLLRLFQEHGIPNNLFVTAGNKEADIKNHLQILERLLPIALPSQKIETLCELTRLVRSLSSRKQSQRALEKNSPSPTVTTLPDDLCHYTEDRTLTVREMARLQSFPDSFVFKGKETTGGDMRRVEVPQYSQVGNAVPPLLAKAIGLQLRRTLSSYYF